MSFSEIKTYFRARLATVDADLKEWPDGFNSDNVPDSILDSAYFIDLSAPMLGNGQNMQLLRYECPVLIRCWFRGFSYPGEAIDTALVKGEAIIKESLKHINRLNQPGIKNVISNSLQVLPVDSTNDNTVKLELSFTCSIYLEVL